MTFTGMTVDGEVGDAGDKIYDGTLTADGYENDGLFDVAVELRGRVQVTLNMGDDYHSLKLSGDSLRVLLEGDFEPEFIRDASGNDTRV